MNKEKFNVKINDFEGPMDLLLYFINRDKIDVYDIPISQITSDYLSYLDLMDELDIDVGADFIYMSALLIQIKTRMLLPRAISEAEDQIEDPRSELVHQILEYKRFKMASDTLEQKLLIHSKKFPKGIDTLSSLATDADMGIPKDLKLFDLALTFKNIVENLPENNELDVVVDTITVEEQINYIREILLKNKDISVSDVIIGSSKTYIINLFLAILELIKVREIDFRQLENFSDIILSRV